MELIDLNGNPTSNLPDAKAISFDYGTFITSIQGLDVSSGGWQRGRFVSTDPGIPDQYTSDGGKTWVNKT